MHLKVQFKVFLSDIHRGYFHTFRSSTRIARGKDLLFPSYRAHSLTFTGQKYADFAKCDVLWALWGFVVVVNVDVRGV